MKKKTIALLSGIALAGGVMGFFGIPNITQLFQNINSVTLNKIIVCPKDRCKNYALDESNIKNVIFADSLILNTSTQLPPASIIIANDIDLLGNTLRGSGELFIITKEIRNGNIAIAEDTEGNSDGLNGNNGGKLYISSGNIQSSLLIDVSGTSGLNGSAGTNGSSGRRGRCDGFGKWRRAKAGANGGPGVKGGNGGSGGEVYLLLANAAPNLSQIDVAGGLPGIGGKGGKGGNGGRGCSGLGGTQTNASQGRNGPSGEQGASGNDGKVNTQKVELKTLKSIYERNFLSDPNLITPEAIREFFIMDHN